MTAFDLEESENRGDLQIVKWVLSPPWLYINEVKSLLVRGGVGQQGVWAEDTTLPSGGLQTAGVTAVSRWSP